MMAESSSHANVVGLEGDELRSSPRWQFPYSQKIAPMVGVQIPSPEKFFSVRCRDLSGGGVAILLDSPPEFDRLVISLGAAPELTHFIAEVVHVGQLEHNGQTRYSVGCQFVRRVYL